MKVFVTTGAIVPFKELIVACLDPQVLSTLSKLGYDELVIQYGKGKQVYDSALPGTTPITVSGFDFSSEVQNLVDSSDLVISHAGTGSIMDAVRSHKPLVVVANKSLMDNHQAEIAAQFSRYGYLLVTTPDKESLIDTLNSATSFSFKKIPAANSRKVAAIIDQEAGVEPN